MEDQELITLTVLIAGRPYPLRIRADEEPAIRRLVKEVNDKLAHFQQTYPDRDKQDYLAMAVLTYAVDLYKAKQVPNNTPQPEWSAQVAHIEGLLDAMLAT